MIKENDDIVNEVSRKFVWNWKYTFVILINAAYIVGFYYIMKAYQF